jgi:predicted peroxiredoxin
VVETALVVGIEVVVDSSGVDSVVTSDEDVTDGCEVVTVAGVVSGIGVSVSGLAQTDT